MTAPDVEAMSLTDLTRHVVETHHVFCRREQVRLAALFRAALEEGGGSDAEIRRLQGSFQRLSAALTQHLRKEEDIVFPLIAQIEISLRDRTPPPQPSFGSVGNPIRMLVLEHDEAEAVLRQMRESSRGFETPAGAAPACRELFSALRGFDADMTRHAGIEDRVLFPRAIAAEQEARAH